jgi:hypothetical protein
VKAKYIQRLLATGAILWIALAIHGQPANDNFANRIPLSGANVDFSGSAEGATFETNDPTKGVMIWTTPGNWYADLNTGSVWWSWTAPMTGYAVVSVINANDALRPKLFVFDGDVMENMTLANHLAQFDVAAGFYGGFRVTAGQPYSIAMVGDYRTNLSFTLRLEASATPIILEQPQSQTVSVGGACFLGVIAPVYGTNHNVQWQHKGVDIPGANAPTLLIKNATAADAGDYRAIVNISDPNATTTSLSATLTVEGSIVQPDIQLRYLSGTTNRFAVTVLGATNEFFAVQYSTNFLFDSSLFVEGLNLMIPYVAYGVETPFLPGQSRVSFLRAVRAGDLNQSCIANLRRIEFAKKMWQVQWNLPDGSATDVYAVDDIGLEGHQLYSCPLGGVITYNAVGTPVICSIPGHHQ